MLSFSEHNELMEALITFGGQAYPKFGNVIIMAGGAGSGKGFVKDNLIGAEGFVFDVDKLKSLAAATPAIQKKVKDELGVDLKDLTSDMTNPDNVSRVHEIVGDYLKLNDKKTEALYKSIITAAPERKPNIIFDVTLKDLGKLQKITRNVKAMGYDNKSIHIVWVVNDIEVAKVQNTKRDRMVAVEILVNTHRGASQTMLDVINMGKTITKYLDGDIVFAFNKVGVDSELKFSGKGGAYIKDSNYFYIKRAGAPVTPLNKLELSIRSKIAKYVPKGVSWD